MLEKLRGLLAHRTVGLLGFGREGRSSYAFLRRLYPEKMLLIADSAPLQVDDSHVRLLTGEGYLEILTQCDFLLKSPGISLRGVALPPGIQVSCQTDLFLRYAPCIKAGVTGSKGKTTTATLLYDMLTASGIPARLMGNMGRPVLDAIDAMEGKIAVIELSSHQLEFTAASPQVAVWTNLYEEHLEHYDGGFLGYATAKANICRHQKQGDAFIYTAEQPLVALAQLADCKGERLPVGMDEGRENPFLQSLCGVNARLRGRHNQQNIFFAAVAALRLGATQEGIRRAVTDFQGVPHRLETVSRVGGIAWVDNCICTIPQGVMMDIATLENVDTLIFGGLDRGLDYENFAVQLLASSVRNFICMPETGHSIAKLLEKRSNNKNVVIVETMEQAVRSAAEKTAQGKTCLLSPAAASYNRYKDFEEKAAHFLECIALLGQ